MAVGFGGERCIAYRLGRDNLGQRHLHNFCMSGAEVAGLVLGLVSATISVIDATKTLYDAAHDASGLPEQFREVAARLPLVLEILEKAVKQLNSGTVKEGTCRFVQPVLEECKLKAEKLESVFKKVLPGEAASWLERYRKAVRTFGKGSRVEELMSGIMDDIQLLADHRSLIAATDEQVQQLKDAIEKIKALDASLSDELEAVGISHSGSGHNFVATGSSIQPVNTGTGAQNTYTAAVTQNYGK